MPTIFSATSGGQLVEHRALKEDPKGSDRENPAPSRSGRLLLMR